jgi:Dna[CI] antecedent, DciA
LNSANHKSENEFRSEVIEMEQLINALPALLRAAGNAEEVTETAALAVWNHVAGSGLRQQTIAVSLQKRTLTVAVADSVWQQQLESLSGQLLFRLNALLGQGTIRFIEFRVDAHALQTRRQQESTSQSRLDDKRMEPKPIPVELVSAAASIDDPNLRRAFLGAANNCLKRRETNQS